jgi:hypothetical protein
MEVISPIVTIDTDHIYRMISIVPDYCHEPFCHVIPSEKSIPNEVVCALAVNGYSPWICRSSGKLRTQLQVCIDKPEGKPRAGRCMSALMGPHDCDVSVL